MRITEQQPLALAASKAVGSPLVRGGLIVAAGLIAGNLLGFLRVAITAYLLGTDSAADALAVALGPLDTLNSVLTNTMVLAFVPMLAGRHGEARTALFLKLNLLFSRIFLVLVAAALLLAPAMMRLLAPGLAEEHHPAAVALFRIASLSSMAAGWTAVHAALLFTERRFAPAAFSQASVSLFTIAGALLLWEPLGVYGFAIGYALGAWVQFAVVCLSARRGLSLQDIPACETSWRELLSKPWPILFFTGCIALNLTLTRAYATHSGPGIAAAFEYCLKCIGVPLGFLVVPLSSSLVPEIAHLRSRFRLPQAFRLMDRTLMLVACGSVVVCTVGIAVRVPAIALLFERGSFTADSTRLVAAVFLGFAPSLVGWSLLELTSRSLFAMERPLLPMIAAAIPVVVNAAFVLIVRSQKPEHIGLGMSVGLLISFLVLLTLARRAQKAGY